MSTLKMFIRIVEHVDLVYELCFLSATFFSFLVSNKQTFHHQLSKETGTPKVTSRCQLSGHCCRGCHYRLYLVLHTPNRDEKAIRGCRSKGVCLAHVYIANSQYSAKICFNSASHSCVTYIVCIEWEVKCG